MGLGWVLWCYGLTGDELLGVGGCLRAVVLAILVNEVHFSRLHRYIVVARCGSYQFHTPKSSAPAY